MPEFLKLLPPDEALSIWLGALPEPQEFAVETCGTSGALNRVLAENIIASESLPPFSRSTVDGYAVRSADTYGATPALPAYLDLIGEVRMGEHSSLELNPGQAVLIHTGGMIPSSADTVVMLEDTQQARAEQIEVLKAAATGENIIIAGEDVQAGQTVLEAGRILRPQEIGGLMALGHIQITVRSKPRVAILSTGDELVPPDSPVAAGQVRDINSYSLGALVEHLGGQVSRRVLLHDDRQELQQALQLAHREDDLVLITAGSSVSERDFTAQAIDTLGEPGVLVHGIQIKPGKPTILAAVAGKPVLGLPGNPVSAFVIAGLFLPPVLRRILGVRGDSPSAVITARLTVNISSAAGRVDFVPVRLSNQGDEWLAEPVYGRSNLIFTLVRADGLIRIPPSATGLEQGTQVTVSLF